MRGQLKGVDAVAKFFDLAETVDLMIRENRYTGEIENQKSGEAILYKIKNVDQLLIDIGKGSSGLIFKVKAKDGRIKNFETTVLQKKIPHLLLTFPDEEVAQKERKSFRANTNISTPLILVKREGELLPDDTMDLGNIENLSDGGCSITTGMKLQKGDIINFFLEVRPSKHETKNLDLHGIVRSVQKHATGKSLLGIQYTRFTNELKEDILAYMKRREDVKFIL